MQPTHLLPQFLSNIYLIIADQPNLIVDSGAHPSLHSNCHHQITYCKLNLNTEYSHPYEHVVWDYNRANVEGIKTSIVEIFCNGKKIPVISPILINNKIVSNFKMKANHFNSFLFPIVPIR